MARKWSNLNLPGALHFVTGNFLNRQPVFSDPACSQVFLEQLATMVRDWPSKLIAYVLMPDHFHLIVNPRDGRIREFMLDQWIRTGGGPMMVRSLLKAMKKIGWYSYHKRK